jgi:hypothetical protein
MFAMPYLGVNILFYHKFVHLELGAKYGANDELFTLTITLRLG